VGGGGGGMKAERGGGGGGGAGAPGVGRLKWQTVVGGEPLNRVRAQVIDSVCAHAVRF